MPTQPHLPAADEVTTLTPDAEVIRSLDDLLRQATTNNGLGRELAYAETATGTRTATAIVLIYERALITIVESPNSRFTDITTETPLRPGADDPAVLLANAVDQFRRDGYPTLVQSGVHA